MDIKNLEDYLFIETTFDSTQIYRLPNSPVLPKDIILLSSKDGDNISTKIYETKNKRHHFYMNYGKMTFNNIPLDVSQLISLDFIEKRSFKIVYCPINN
jgi:hypothetical protein